MIAYIEKFIKEKLASYIKEATPYGATRVSQSFGLQPNNAEKAYHMARSLNGMYGRDWSMYEMYKHYPGVKHLPQDKARKLFTFIKKI